MSPATKPARKPVDLKKRPARKTAGKPVVLKASPAGKTAGIPAALKKHTALARSPAKQSSRRPVVPAVVPDDADLVIDSHLDPDITDVCGYCGTKFVKDEIVVERTIHGRLWRFCGDGCFHAFMNDIQFQDEDLFDDDDNVKVTDENAEPLPRPSSHERE